MWYPESKRPVWGVSFSLDLLKNPIQLFRWHIENRIVRRERFLRHPLGDAVVLSREASPAVELAFHLEGLLAQFCQDGIG